MVDMKVTDAGGTNAVPVSTRFVSCPISQIFSSARVSIGTTSVETRGSHYGMLAQLAARNNVTREAALTAGSQSLLDFETKMLPYDGKTDTRARTLRVQLIWAVALAQRFRK